MNFHSKNTIIFYTFSMYLCWKNNFIFPILERMLFRLSVYLSRKIVVKNDDFCSGDLLACLLAAAGWLATGFTVLIVRVIVPIRLLLTPKLEQPTQN